MKKQEQYLNELVSSLGVYYVKLHQYHWFVEGPSFYTLHEQFENMYDEVTTDLDEVAERMLQLKLKPASTLKEYLEHSFIEESPYTRKISANKMVENTLADYKIFVEKVKEGYDVFTDDEVTTDLLVGLQAKYEKHIWMLEASSK